MTTPTTAAIEAARERLAKVTEAKSFAHFSADYRAGAYDDQPSVQTLAIALQEMSDAVGRVFAGLAPNNKKALAPFILPDHVDPLVEALVETFPRANGAEGMAADLREALAARGLQIVPVQP